MKNYFSSSMVFCITFVSLIDSLENIIDIQAILCREKLYKLNISNLGHFSNVVFWEVDVSRIILLWFFLCISLRIWYKVIAGDNNACTYTHTRIISNVHNFLFVSLFPIGLWIDWCPLAWFRYTNAPVTKIYFLEEDESDCENKHFSVKKEVENDHLLSSFFEFS